MASAEQTRASSKLLVTATLANMCRAAGESRVAWYAPGLSTGIGEPRHPADAGSCSSGEGCAPACAVSPMARLWTRTKMCRRRCLCDPSVDTKVTFWPFPASASRSSLLRPVPSMGPRQLPEYIFPSASSCTTMSTGPSSTSKSYTPWLSPTLTRRKPSRHDATPANEIAPELDAAP